jgi:hypothetical protein
MSEIKFSLPNRKVFVKPIIKKGQWLSEGHSGHFMYDYTKLVLCVPLDQHTGTLKDPLTLDERLFFENKELSGMDFNLGDLNIHKKNNKFTGSYNFWNTFEVVINKDQGVVDNDTTLIELNLSQPMDYLRYKVLLANSGVNGIVAPSWDARFNSGSYKIVLVDAGYDSEAKASKAELLTKAYAQFAKLQKSKTKMFEFLSVYWLENKKAIKPPVDADSEFLIGQIQDIISTDIKGFLQLVEDSYEEKLIIHKGMMINAIIRDGSLFLTADGIPLGNSLRDVILYYRDERHQEEKLKLIALINMDKK